MRFERGDATRVVLHFSAQGVTESAVERAVERRTHVAHGVVTRSLFYAGEQAGLTDSMVLKLANAFGYDIDFAQDLREGDSFSVIYDDVYREGEHLRDGDIIAATFINQGKRYTAPSGTPIRAAGDGKITFRGWKSGYGNFVIVQHNTHISTAYGHMSRFASEQIGQRVKQGQIIGFVGMTGLATGPHLHYEFRVDGEHRDPLNVTLPLAEPLPPTQLAQFRQKSAPMLAKLKMVAGARFARAD